MALARSVLLRASKSQWLARQMTQRAFARRAVRKFMPGEQLSDALGAAEQLAPAQIGTIITRLGETLTGERDSSEVRNHYLGALAEIERRGLPTQLSVKPTQLGLDASVRACAQEIGTLVERAQAARNFIWVDMEDSSYVDRTLELYEELRSRYECVGLCLQSYLFRTPKDLERLMPLRPAIRLVKGAYAEPADVAFAAKRDTDEQYRALGETLLAAASQGRAFPVFGTHDLTLLRHLHGVAQKLQLGKSQFETHMLYGIRAESQRELAAAGLGVRCLVSYGANWFPWYMRRLAERPANVWFVVKSSFA